MNRKSRGIAASALALLLAVSLEAGAVQHDAEYYELEKQFGEQWAADSEAVQAKLEELEKRFGKKPNIIKILVDDVGYTELGAYGGGKLRGAPTPNLDRLADEGMRLLQYYSEVSCTPSRLALNTGRHNVRLGVNQVDFPGTTEHRAAPGRDHGGGASFEARATTRAMFGKWHVGFGDKYAPTEHGFDEAEWSGGNPAVWVYGAKADDDGRDTSTSGRSTGRPRIRRPTTTKGECMRAKKGEKPEMAYPFTGGELPHLRLGRGRSGDRLHQAPRRQRPALLPVRGRQGQPLLRRPSRLQGHTGPDQYRVPDDRARLQPRVESSRP